MVLLKAYVYFYLFIVWIRFPKSSSLQEIIRHRYGNDTVKLVRKMEKLDFKHRKCQLDLDFLLDCQRHNVVPNFLFFKLANRRLQTSEKYRSCQHFLLNSEIEEKRRNIQGLENEVLLRGWSFLRPDTQSEGFVRVRKIFWKI